MALIGINKFSVSPSPSQKKSHFIPTLIYQTVNGGVANVTLPSDIASGEYLIRHEIIALHLATEMGGAEFYPSCSQLKIGGNGTAVPSADELVSFPGAYSDDDPGIYVPDVKNP
jgi:hypothetical protein